MNLLKETLAELIYIKKDNSDIEFIGSSDGEYACTWNHFCELANIEYDKSYGSNKIAIDLVIVFKDGSWLSRREYDGSEWWEYNELPTKKPNCKIVTNILNINYQDEVS